MKNHDQSVRYQKFQLLLREVRTELEITQFDLAKLLGKPQSYVSKFESGERRLDFIEVQDVCSALGISLTDFVCRFEKKLNG